MQLRPFINRLKGFVFLKDHYLAFGGKINKEFDKSIFNAFYILQSKQVLLYSVPMVNSITSS